jgi:formiminotetrahydrofolate cyclodeaminase
MSDNPQDLLSLSVRDFINATAAKTPTPGGGSVAAVVGALGTALGEMALAFTRGKKKFAAHEALHAQAAARLAKARQLFDQLVADDVEAFGMYQSTSQQPDGPDKEQAMQLATAAAIDVPREAAKLALAVLGDLKLLADKCTKFLISDLMAGAVLAEAATRLCDYNVQINLPYVADKSAAGQIGQASGKDVQRATLLRREIEQAGRKVMAAG